MKKITGLLMMMFMIISAPSFSQEKVAPKVQVVKIKTSAICGSCKKRIEEKLNYTKGIVFAELNLDTKEVTVKFKTKVISANEIRQIIVDLGYDADDLKKNEEAFSNLPKCCRVEGEHHE